MSETCAGEPLPCQPLAGGGGDEDEDQLIGEAVARRRLLPAEEERAASPLDRRECSPCIKVAAAAAARPSSKHASRYA